MLEFTCANCGRHVQGDDSIAGKLVQCPVCKTVMTAPDPSQPSPMPAGPTADNADETYREKPSRALLGLRPASETAELHQHGPGETLQLNWDRLSVRALWHWSSSLLWFLYLLHKKIFGIPIGSTPYPHGEPVPVSRDQASPHLLEEEKRTMAGCFAEGFASVGCYRFVNGRIGIALLSSDGQIGLLIAMPNAGETFWWCTRVTGCRLTRPLTGLAWSYMECAD
jgi:hypothetical protein